MTETPAISTESPKESGLLKKILAVQEAVGTVGKSGYNAFHKYAYVKEENLLDALRPLLALHGLIVTASVLEEREEDQISKVKMRFHVYDVDTTHCIAADFVGYGQDTGDKGVYKAMTGASKYFCSKFFRISVGDDPEEDGGVAPAPRKTTASIGAPEKLVDDLTMKKIEGAAIASGGTLAKVDQLAMEKYGKSTPNLTQTQADALLAVLLQKVKASAFMAAK